MDSKVMQHNAHKFAYLVETYPEKTVSDIIGLFRISPIDINCAIWLAIENGLVSQVNSEQPRAELLRAPKVWDFGDNVAELEKALEYAFTKLNAEEKDMEENYMANWTTGYYPQDVLIAVKHLIERGILHEYEIEDGDNNYIFYTLKANAGKNWGAKQFKQNPLTGEPNPVEQEAATTETPAQE